MMDLDSSAVSPHCQVTLDTAGHSMDPAMVDGYSLIEGLNDGTMVLIGPGDHIYHKNNGG